jgi:hypothetical protein
VKAVNDFANSVMALQPGPKKKTKLRAGQLTQFQIHHVIRQPKWVALFFDPNPYWTELYTTADG